MTDKIWQICGLLSFYVFFSLWINRVLSIIDCLKISTNWRPFPDGQYSFRRNQSQFFRFVILIFIPNPFPFPFFQIFSAFCRVPENRKYLRNIREKTGKTEIFGNCWDWLNPVTYRSFPSDPFLPISPWFLPFSFPILIGVPTVQEGHVSLVPVVFPNSFFPIGICWNDSVTSPSQCCLCTGSVLITNDVMF